jgi:hypothetical protein
MMVDIETRRVIDMIDSRNTADVIEWLMTYPNLEVVSRDGSIAFKSAIKSVNPEIIQVSDRFHLLSGLTDAAKKLVTSTLEANISIPSTGVSSDALVSGYWDKDRPPDFPAREHASGFNRKVALVEQVIGLTEEGYTRGAIAEKLGISYPTVKKYQSPGFSPTHALYNTTRFSKITPYTDDIKGMLEKGVVFREIEEAIRLKGFDGASSTIRMFATRERKLLKEARAGTEGPVEKIERKWLIKLLYKPFDESIRLTKEQLAKVTELYPVIGDIYDVVQGFRQALFSKKPEELKCWITDTEQLLNFPDITSFINGIRNDMAAVEKAIELDYSNGLAEGSVNKIKVTKRIMYGRCSFGLLKAKQLRLELKRKIN